LRVNAPAVTLARSCVRLLSALVGCAVGLLVGCATPAPTTVYTPITGIQIRSSDIVAGHGCGQAAQQVYKYVAIIAYRTDGGAPGVPIASAVFDCFADGIFSNLPALDSGGQAFDVRVYAYNAFAFPCQGLACPQASCPLDDAGVAKTTVAACSGEDASVATQAVAAMAANWEWACTVEQVPGVTSVASCTPLAPSEAGPVDGGSGAE
jgi:hypothetical protein